MELWGLFGGLLWPLQHTDKETVHTAASLNCRGISGPSVTHRHTEERHCQSLAVEEKNGPGLSNQTAQGLRGILQVPSQV